MRPKPCRLSINFNQKVPKGTAPKLVPALLHPTVKREKPVIPARTGITHLSTQVASQTGPRVRLPYVYPIFHPIFPRRAGNSAQKDIRRETLLALGSARRCTTQEFLLL